MGLLGIVMGDEAVTVLERGRAVVEELLFVVGANIDGPCPDRAIPFKGDRNVVRAEAEKSFDECFEPVRAEPLIFDGKFPAQLGYAARRDDDADDTPSAVDPGETARALLADRSMEKEIDGAEVVGGKVV